MASTALMAGTFGGKRGEKTRYGGGRFDTRSISALNPCCEVRGTKGTKLPVIECSVGAYPRGGACYPGGQEGCFKGA